MSNFNALATAGRQLEEAVRIQKMMEEGGASTDEHMKAMWAGQSNVLVAVRVRPLLKHDVIKKSCVRVMDGKIVFIADPAMGDKLDILRANRNREKQYAFDYVFEPGASQEAVFLHTTKFLIHGVLDGYNATVFAYGQTGSGKTHTMIGSPTDPGIMVRVMEHLFIYSASFGEQQRVDYKVAVSFLEVYNENIRDLLSETEEYLDLREDPIKGPMVAGITEVETKSSEEIMNLLHQGNARRSQAATAANEVSSRSHAVLQVIVESKDKASGVVANIKVGKLSLVDLAGSERAANTKNTGVRLVEGANINRSLLALGNCINALGEKGNKGNFVPYRDSKLTRLLKDSLGGNCRTVMIANISSAESSFEETSNTLKYANRAKNIKTNVQRNVLNVNYHISEYVQLIDNLRNEIKVLKDQLSAQPQQSFVIEESSIDNSLISQDNSNLAALKPIYSDSKLEDISMISNISNRGPAAGLRINSNLPGPHFISQPSPTTHASGLRHPGTPLEMLRESMKSAASLNDNRENRELLNKMRENIVDNFQERMQLRRSLIELEDQNVQNSIEVGKRQLMVVQWCEMQGLSPSKIKGTISQNRAEFSAELISKAPSDIREAWQECEQLRKAIMKNNSMKKNIARRLRHNEREAEKFRDEMQEKVTGEDRRELMELQYQVGRLELENMELEQNRIVHESVLKGKDLTIQKLKLQLAVRDKIIQRQKTVLSENDLDHKVGYAQLALLEQTLMTDVDMTSTMVPPSPPRNISDLSVMGNRMDMQRYEDEEVSEEPVVDEESAIQVDEDDSMVGGRDWSELPVNDEGDDSYILEGNSPRGRGGGGGGLLSLPAQSNSSKSNKGKIGKKIVKFNGNNNNNSNNNSGESDLSLEIQGNNVLPLHMKEQIQGLRSQGVRANRQYRFPADDSANTSANGSGGDRGLMPLRPQIQPLPTNYSRKYADAKQDDSDNEGIGIVRGNAYYNRSSNSNANNSNNSNIRSKGNSGSNSQERLKPLENIPSLSNLSVIEDIEESMIEGSLSHRGENQNSGMNKDNNNNGYPMKHAMIHPMGGSNLSNGNNGNVSGYNGRNNNGSNNSNNNNNINSGNNNRLNRDNSYSDDDFLDESIDTIGSDSESNVDSKIRGGGNNNARGSALATIDEDQRSGKSAKNAILGKLKNKIANNLNTYDPDPPYSQSYLENQSNDVAILQPISNAPRPGQKLKSVRPRIIQKSSAASNTASSDGGGPTVSHRIEAVPQIGNRNRSLPNLPKQGSGPNSSRKS